MTVRSVLFNVHVILISAARLFHQDPVDRIAELNEWVPFNCTLNCACVERFGWYMAGHSNAIRNNGSITGLTIMRRQRTACTSGQRTYSIEVLATEALNKSAIYCAVVSKADCQHECSASRRCYSRPALLIGKLRCCLHNLVNCFLSDSNLLRLRSPKQISITSQSTFSFSI